MRGALGFRQKHAGRERQEELKRKKQKFSFFPCCTSRGRRKRNSVAQNDTVLLFFFLKSMKRRRFGQNAPFHLNMAPTCQLPNQSLIYLLFISIASLSTSIAAIIVGRIFYFGHWSLIYAIGPSIDQ
jgi:hypothetical protein